MLNELKKQHAELLVLNTKICRKIEKKLGQELPAYFNMNTEIDLNKLNPLHQANLYKLKIASLKAKLCHSDDMLTAFDNGEDLKEFDLFREIGVKL